MTGHAMATQDRQGSGQGAGQRWGKIPAWWLDHPELDADGFAVLAALATYADENGLCWPSQSTLAMKLKRSRPTINRILQRLGDLGLVAIEHRQGRDGARLSCLYRLRLVHDDGKDGMAEPAVRLADRDDSPTNAPCPAASQEQLQLQQIPDSLAECRRDAMQDVSPDWMPGADDLAWARDNHGDVDMARHIEGFVLRCQAHGYRYRNIGAAWKAWLIQDFAAGKAPVVPANGTASPRGFSASSFMERPRDTAVEQRLGAWMAAAARLQNVSPATRSWS